MKRVFFLGVIVYSVAILLFNDWPAATNYNGTAAVPWMIKCLVDLCFGLFAGYKLFGAQIHWDEDEVGVHADDISVPDTWFYGIFGLNLFCNFGWHGYEFANLNGPAAVYNSVWFFAEFFAMLLTFVFFKHAGQVARREQRRAREAAQQQGGQTFTARRDRPAA